MGYSSGYTATHLEDVSHIWISRVEDSDGIIEKMDGIEATLTKLNPADVAVGDEVVTRFTQDGCMYRARVQQISGDLVKVLYFDFGNGEQVSINDLWKMPSNLQDIPPAAVKVIIDGTQGVEDNDTIRAEIENKLFVDDGLQVKLTKAEDGNLTARFGFKDKKIKFSFSKSQSKEVGSNNNQVNNSSPIKEEKDDVKCVEIPKSNSKIVMFNDLPSMKLLAKVEISGAVVNVSPLGTVWFTPTWIQGSLDSLSNKIDESSAHLEPVNPEDVCTNLLCIARNGSDGYLYRAKIVEQLENSVCTVKYIDYGDCEKILISNIFYLPVGLNMMAPAAAEIVLASPPSPLSDCQVKLEETLLERDLVLLLEEEESGVKVGRFFENGNEIKWEGLVDSKTVLEKTHKTQHEEDVVVETESQAKQTTPKEHTAQPVKVDVIQEKATEDVQEKPTEKGKDIQEKPKKLYKVVPASVPADGEECSVFLGYVESVSKVWMCREDDESRINNIMESLASIPDLVPAERFKVLGVFGCRFSQDGELYRAAIVDRLTGSSQVKVQFIDFGNFEAKDSSELLCIPEDLATQPSAAFAVSIKTSYQDTKDNQSKIEEILSQDNLKVNMTGGCGTFYVNETEIVFGDESTEAESTNDVSMHLPQKPMEFSAAETPCLSTVEEVSESESPPNEAVVTPVNDSIVVEPPTPSAEATITVAPVTPTTPKLVPVSSFKRAIEAVKTQDDCSMSRTRRSSSSELPWTVGEVVTVRYDEVWRNATVTKIRGEMVEVNVDKCNAAPLWVEARHVRSACLPADALNLIDKDINYNSVRENGDGADLTVDHSVAIGVGKVQDWIRKNQQTVPDKLVIKSPVKKNLPNSLPTGPALLDYCKSTAGSHHVQSILSSSDRDFSLQILQTLIKSPNTMSILTGASSSFVIQKLVSVLPSSDLAPLHNILASNFIRLSLDKFGCRLVQFYLEYCSKEQQILIANQICCQSTIKALACDSNGTFVAQSCLPHLMKYPDQVQALVQAVLGCTVELGSHHHGTYFMQCLVTSLAGQQMTSVCQQMLFEDIMSNLSVLAVTEPGSRLLQEFVKVSPHGILLRVVNWIVDHIEDVIEIRSAVFLALATIGQIVAMSSEDSSWLILLEKLTFAMLHNNQDSAVPLIVYSSLQSGGYLVAREVVSRLNLVSIECKNEVLLCLNANIDQLRFNKNGCTVLKSLNSVLE